MYLISGEIEIHNRSKPDLNARKYSGTLENLNFDPNDYDCG